MSKDSAQFNGVDGQTRGEARHGTVLIARRDGPLQSTDLNNVVPFARPRRQGGTPAIALPSVDAADRPATAPARFGWGRGMAVLAGSLAVHGAVFAVFWRDPPPLASIGIEAISVEFTLGATTAAGIAPNPGEQEVQAAAPAEAQAAEEVVAEQSRVATLMPQEVPVAAQETAPEARPQETPPEIATVEPQPVQQRPQPETTVSEIPAETKPVERPPEQAVQAPAVPEATAAPERKRIAAPTETKASQKKQRTAAARSDAASGVGRGRSDVSANYNGLVAAHLARHKQYPAEARRAGAQGVATVSFALDGNGRIVSVSLARATGIASIDREAVAMVRRASPFPRPPDGRGRNFTVPVRFNLR